MVGIIGTVPIHIFCADPHRQAALIKLVEMKNLGASSINLLADIGIRTPEDLRAIGSVKAFRRIRQRGTRVPVALLYALEGAILDIAWQDMDVGLKTQLVQMAERINQEESISAITSSMNTEST